MEFIDKLKNKDNEAIGILYKRYGRKLYGYAISQWKINEDDSWELIYKTLYKVIENIDKYSFTNEKSFVGFIFKVFINNLKNHLRDTKGSPIASEELTDNLIISSDENSSQQDNDSKSPLMLCLEKVLSTLDDWQRILLLMRAQNYSYQHIASFINRPEKQLKVYNLRLRNTVTQNTNLCVEEKGYEG